MNKKKNNIQHPENKKYTEMLTGRYRILFAQSYGLSIRSVEAFLAGRRSGRRLKMQEKAEQFIVRIEEFENSLLINN
ncbi:MAG: hypothetical protein ACRDDZ_11270 [Marinifilaceae bacterium]